MWANPTGKEEDVEVGLVYFGKRYLNTALQRWASADPLEVHAAGEADANLYAYVSGRALRNVDPLGLCGSESGAGGACSSGEGGTGSQPGATDEELAAREQADKAERTRQAKLEEEFNRIDSEYRESVGEEAYSKEYDEAFGAGFRNARAEATADDPMSATYQERYNLGTGELAPLKLEEIGESSAAIRGEAAGRRAYLFALIGSAVVSLGSKSPAAAMMANSSRALTANSLEKAARALEKSKAARGGPISVGEGLERASAFMKEGVAIQSIDGKTGVQFVQQFTENGQTITKRAGFDLNPNSSHVKQLGPHLNLQTQINGKIVKKGPFADPHISIDPKTIRSGDY